MNRADPANAATHYKQGCSSLSSCGGNAPGTTVPKKLGTRHPGPTREIRPRRLKAQLDVKRPLQIAMTGVQWG